MTSGTEDCVRVGVGVFVERDERVLLGLRKGEYGKNTWAFPGGHLEFNETIEECVLRELKEETGLDGDFQGVEIVTNDRFNSRHYITLFGQVVIANDAEPQALEPDKTEEWKWFRYDEIPNNIFGPTKLFLDNHKKSTFFIESS